ncbi:MAG: hypothetical protein ACK4PH_28755 [Aquincola tertiaricarbonis]|uniref:hypothetical protein n=1 Tax=Aquincola tertiaricarbonis TaxID=391953 RepID=UPI0006151657|nr:hypothetical protein [Aquincola tertiaricarbonis]
MNRAGLFAATAAACGLMLACSAAPVAKPPPLSPPGNAEKQLLIEAIGSAACTSDEQCHTMAVGRKACGGPQAWLPWSSQVTDGIQLQALADRYTQAQTPAAAGDGRASTCSVVPDPGAACMAGRCGLRTGLPLK